MKNDILKLFRAYERETEFDGQAINEKMYNALAEEIVKLFEMPVVNARILDDLKNKAKEADEESDRIGAADREGGFEKSGEATGLEIAIEVVDQYMP